MKNKVLIYGANGYTGELIARFAKNYSIEPIVAGRTEATVVQVALKYNLPYHIFSLDDKEALHNALKYVAVVIHAAGPFRYTAKQMVEACIETGTHYLDINGDISVFEFIRKYDAKAKAANVMLLPGSGFDVVPTDCVAYALHQQMPDATHLEIAFLPSGGGGLSHGTATTMAGKAGEGGCVRENGELKRKPLGHTAKWIAVDGKRLFAMSIPWGDISTAYVSTGIPNIITYTGMKPSVYRVLKFQFLFNWLLRTTWMRNMIQNKINSRPAGPTDGQRVKGKTYVWAQVRNDKGETRSAAIQTADGYTVTYEAVLIITKKILNGEFKPGYQTPAAAYGEGLIYELSGTKKL
ncbi:MAG: saccharopine dehydrogenase NADP-binding domain-containing protein [Chitinophagaceae bacterium]|nr:saccharopine dehydrogenase NADP-binding domain-containing protein [Chitinophagaceae bacterium]